MPFTTRRRTTPPPTDHRIEPRADRIGAHPAPRPPADGGVTNPDQIQESDIVGRAQVPQTRQAVRRRSPAAHFLRPEDIVGHDSEGRFTTVTGRTTGAAANLQSLPRESALEAESRARTYVASTDVEVDTRPGARGENAVPIDEWRPSDDEATLERVEAAVREHAEISCSGLKNVAICPAYVPEPREEQTTGAADEGRLLHRAVETGYLPPDLDEEQQSSVQMCLDYIAPLLDEDPTNTEIHRELRLDLNQAQGPRELDDMFGTADLVIYNHVRRHCHVVDFKFGRIPVDDAEVNLQGKAYVVGAFLRFPQCQNITIHFLQPRTDEVSSHTFGRGDLVSLQLEISAILARARRPDREEHVNPDNCLYCGRKTECLALRRLAIHITDRYQNEFTALPNLHSSEVGDPEQLAIMLKMAKIVARWADSVKSHSLQTYLGGTPIPGFELKERAGARKIEDGDNVLAAFAGLTVTDAHGNPLFSQEDVLRCATLTVGKLEEMAASKAEEWGMTKAAAKRKISKELADLGVVSVGNVVHYLQAER